MTIHWKAVEQYFTVVLFTQFIILGTLSILRGLDTVRSEWVKLPLDPRVALRLFFLDRIVRRQTLLNPLSHGVKLRILLLCFHAFLTEVVGRSC